MVRVVRALLVALALLAPALSQSLPSGLVAHTEAKEVTVYVTRTGAKYHRGSCRYLSRSKIPMALSEAVKSYAPCSVCRPPTE
jgi:hypothetical protein